MIPDPAQHLFDVGQRVIRTLRPLVAAPQLDSLPEGCRELLFDPIEILSYTCGELVGRTTTEPAVTSGQPHDPPAPDQRAGTLTPFSRAMDGATTRVSGWCFDRQGGSQEGLPDTLAYGPGEPSFPAQVRRTTDAPPSLFQDAPARHPGSHGSAIMTRPDAPGGDPASLAHSRQPLDGGPPDLRGATRAFERRTVVEENPPGSEASYGEPSFDADADASPPARRRGPEGGQAGPLRRATALTREDSALDGHPVDEPGDEEHKTVPAGHDPAHMPPERPVSRRADEEPVPEAPETAVTDEREGARLVSDSSRLVAMLRENVVIPEAPFGSPNMVPSGAPDSVPVDDAATIGPQPEDGRFDQSPGGRDLQRPADRIGVEEVLERLAEELETEYVRTYGSSGV